MSVKMPLLDIQSTTSSIEAKVCCQQGLIYVIHLRYSRCLFVTVSDCKPGSERHCLSACRSHSDELGELPLPPHYGHHGGEPEPDQLSLVDLAGSERAAKTDVKDHQLKVDEPG